LDVHLVDGTYELFRHFFALPSTRNANGAEVGALIGVAESLLTMLERGATHVGVATDHVVESFRNELWPGYKTGEGIDPSLRSQFEPLEELLDALGFVVWRMVEFEADDALASAALRAQQDPDVERVFICTPDKDLGQSVVGQRVVQLDRRSGKLRNAAGVVEKFGVPPESIPDYLALVGDSADGFPGLPGWGSKSAARVLRRFGHLESIPRSPAEWDLEVRGRTRLAETLAAQWEIALLFRELATLRTDVPAFVDVEELRWAGPRPHHSGICQRLDAGRAGRRAVAIAEARS
jgi:5'-3' exonuclease